jgi:hypothetical protein
VPTIDDQRWHVALLSGKGWHALQHMPGALDYLDIAEALTPGRGALGVALGGQQDRRRRDILRASMNSKHRPADSEYSAIGAPQAPAARRPLIGRIGCSRPTRRVASGPVSLCRCGNEATPLSRRG